MSANGRRPPHDLKAEEHLLGAMMLSGSITYNEAGRLGVDDFYKPAHAHIFEAIRALTNPLDPVAPDAVMIADRLAHEGVLDGVGIETLVQIQASCPTPANAEAYVEIVDRKSKLRRYAYWAYMAQLAALDDEDTDKARSLLENALWNLGSAVKAADISVVTVDEFAHFEEAGVDALVGDQDDILVGANTDVVVYGDGGAGKTTLSVDLAVHMAAGADWLGINVPEAVNVLLIENEGPRSLFRAKLARKIAAETCPSFDERRLRVLDEPWTRVSFAEDSHRSALAELITDYDIDAVVIGPVTAAGMNDAGTIQEVRAFLDLIGDVRQRAGRPVTFVLIHHENKAGQVSGAWEGASDTLLHVQSLGHGRTRMFIQKARWSPTWHAKALDLAWAEGESYTVDEKPEVTDDDIADAIADAVSRNPGVGWTKVREMVVGVREKRRATIRDRLLKTGKLVNVVKVDGVESAIDHCPERRPARLFLADDPAIAHLVPGREPDGNQADSARGRAETSSGSLVPSYRGNQGGNQTSGASPELDLTGGSE